VNVAKESDAALDLHEELVQDLKVLSSLFLKEEEC